MCYPLLESVLTTRKTQHGWSSWIFQLGGGYPICTYTQFVNPGEPIPSIFSAADFRGNCEGGVWRLRRVKSARKRPWHHRDRGEGYNYTIRVTGCGRTDEHEIFLDSNCVVDCSVAGKAVVSAPPDQTEKTRENDQKSILWVAVPIIMINLIGMFLIIKIMRDWSVKSRCFHGVRSSNPKPIHQPSQLDIRITSMI